MPRDIGLLKLGRVMRQDAAAGTVVVAFGADDAMASWSLPVMQPKTLNDKAYWMPDVGELVVCLMDERAEFGVVLGAIYSQSEATPIASLDKLHVAFKDGTTLEYDRAAHVLAIALAGGGAVSISAQQITLTVPDGARVDLGGDGGDQLVTKSWVTERFAAHVHPSLGAPPTPVGDLPTWYTQKAHGE